MSWCYFNNLSKLLKNKLYIIFIFTIIIIVIIIIIIIERFIYFLGSFNML